MNTPLDCIPESEERRTVFYDSVFAYCDRCQHPIDDGADEIALQTMELRHADGDVSIYDRAGNFLACEASREEALHEAHSMVTAFIHGAAWSVGELLAGRGHFQRCFPELAREHGIRPEEPDSSSPHRS